MTEIKYTPKQVTEIAESIRWHFMYAEEARNATSVDDLVNGARGILATRKAIPEDIQKVYGSKMEERYLAAERLVNATKVLRKE